MYDMIQFFIVFFINFYFPQQEKPIINSSLLTINIVITDAASFEWGSSITPTWGVTGDMWFNYVGV